MKLQPAQHALTRPAPSDDVEGVSADRAWSRTFPGRRP